MSGQPDRIRLLADGEAAPEGCTIVEAHVPYVGQEAVFRVAVAAGPVTLQDVAPLARAICDDLVRRIIRGVEAAGARISCSKGCGACCSSYLVPMTVPEAMRLVEDLQALGPRQRRRLEGLFLQAERKLVESGLAGQMASLDPNDPASTVQQRELAGKWWSENRFPCPLLEGSACGLYRSRPMPCREFLALSDPRCCATNTETRAARPFSMHQVVAAWAAEFEGTRPTLVLLANLLGWWQHNAERARRTWPAPILVRRFMEILTQTAEQAAKNFQSPVPPTAAAQPPPPETT